MAKLERIMLGGFKSYPVLYQCGLGYRDEIFPYQHGVPDSMYYIALSDGHGSFEDADGQLWDATFPKAIDLTSEQWGAIWDARKHEIDSSNYVSLEDIFMALPSNWSLALTSTDDVKKERLALLFHYKNRNYPLTETEKMLAHKDWLWQYGYINGLVRPTLTPRGVKALTNNNL